METINFDEIKQQIKYFKLSVRDYRRGGNTIEAQKVDSRWSGYMKGLEDAGVDEGKLVDIIEETDREIKNGAKKHI